MGDPRRIKKKYFTPKHPWIQENLDAERELVKEYSVKRKCELYKLNSILKIFKDQAKNLIAATTAQAEKEKKQLIARLNRLGLVKPEAAMDDILSLTIRDLMNRRLQFLVFKKGLARTQAQARQFICHNHIIVGDKKLTSPNALIAQAEEDSINFYPGSHLSKADHPERLMIAQPRKEEPKKEEKKEFHRGQDKRRGRTPRKPRAEKPQKEKKSEKPKAA